MVDRRRCALAGLLTLGALACSAPRQPQFSSHLAVATFVPCPASPNCVSSQAADAAHYIEPLHVVGDPALAMDNLRRVIASMPRTRIVAMGSTTLRAEFTSAIFRFVDDVDLQLDAADRLVWIRSASRTGYCDFGVNRRRVETIRERFSQLSAGKSS